MRSDPLHIDLTALADPFALAARWQALEARSDSSFFLGWTWIGSWLDATGARPDLLSVTRDGQDQGLALLGFSAARRPLGRTPTLHLNQAGDPGVDRVFIEYNGLLAARQAAPDIIPAVLRFLANRNGWRVLRLGGVQAPSPLLSSSGFRRRLLISELPAYFIDLAAVGAANGDYLSLLSNNSRAQIRRSQREYGEGESDITRAVSSEETDNWLEDMRLLNAGRHADNAWDEPLFRAFVRQLVLTGLENGEVELLRVTQGGALLGYLLNFVYRGRAMNYQSAFAPGISPKAKPGLMCHAAAVARYADAGHQLYSLLAGNDRYKQSLSTGHETLQWWSLERFSLVLEAEHILRKILRRPVSA